MPDASSNYHFEIDMQETSLVSADIDSIEPEQILTLEREGEKIVVRIPLVCELEFEASVDLGVYDSTDKDFVHLSTENVSKKEEFELDLLLTFSVYMEDGESTLEFEGAELLPIQLHVNFGEIEPDFSDHYEPN